MEPSLKPMALSASIQTGTILVGAEPTVANVVSQKSGAVNLRESSNTKNPSPITNLKLSQGEVIRIGKTFLEEVCASDVIV